MKPISYACHRFPTDVIRRAVWLYFQFTLSFRDVEDFAFVIDGAPQEHSLPIDPHHHLLQMPAAGGNGPGFPQVAGEEISEFPCPAADNLIAHVDATLGHKVFASQCGDQLHREYERTYSPGDTVDRDARSSS